MCRENYVLIEYVRVCCLFKRCFVILKIYAACFRELNELRASMRRLEKVNKELRNNAYAQGPASPGKVPSLPGVVSYLLSWSGELCSF